MAKLENWRYRQFDCSRFLFFPSVPLKLHELSSYGLHSAVFINCLKLSARVRWSGH